VAYWPSTLRSRLTLWYTTLLGVPLVALALGSYLLFGRTLEHRTDRFLDDALAAFSRELVAERRVALSPATAMRTTATEVRFRDLHIAILDSAANIVAISPEADADAARGRLPDSLDAWVVAAMREREAKKPQAFTIASRRGDYRVNARPLVIDGQHFALTGAYSLDDIEAVLQRVKEVFLVAIPLLLLCAASGGYFLAARSLVPLSAMAARAAEISAANLEDRLPVAGGEELAGLARVVNSLLDRLEASFGQQRRFMADASHELRTPTAILRTEADVTLAQEHRAEEDYRASFTIIQDAARRLTRIVDDLFLLARADAGILIERRETVYLEELLHDATRGVRLLADRRAIRVELGDVVEAPFQGDADLLGRLLLNLLDNAIKHSPNGGTVDVGMVRNDGRYEISVVDGGEGIPPEAQPRIFERFFRGDAERSRRDHLPAGAGLGLAIARRIAELHGGRLELVESRPGRTEFRVALPVGS
jgi:heavy metal sensor kinase